MPTVHEFKKKNRISFFISIRLMQLQFVIALKALWHAMTGSHLECMGCQLFMKEKKESFFFKNQINATATQDCI